MSIGKTYYPTKEFDDKLKGLSKLVDDEGWELPGLTAEQLCEDAEAQRAEREEHDALRREYLALHEKFGLAQLARHQRYMAALNALRGIFREDKAMMAKLDEFTRVGGRPRKASTEEAA